MYLSAVLLLTVPLLLVPGLSAARGWSLQQGQRQTRSNLAADPGCAGRQEVDRLTSQLLQQTDLLNRLQDRLHVLETSLHTDTPPGPVAFHVDFGHLPYHNVTVLSNSSCKFDRVLINEGGGYDPSTGQFTAPQAGLYSFSLHVVGGDHDGFTNLALQTGNQTVAVAFTEGQRIDSNDQGSCSAVLRLKQGQQVRVILEYGNPLIWGSNLSSFSGFLVQADVDH
ncbi:cerebellin-3-like [Babylonia areolata]|uniref:cerebellin-3-like n=1 Tax=Babylonia areolata TaxID=304850 RepID=UPI003FD11F02